jgi:peroxiredoxin
MRPILLSALLLVLAGCLPTSAASGEATVGAAAPDFTLTDTDGNAVTLSSFSGQTVVLEWFNPDCPFVKYAHGDKGPLAGQPKRATDGGVVWLAVNSGAPGKQGHGLDRNKAARTTYSMDYPVLIDEDGTVGRLYGARTTPHMFVIDGGGTLVYAGGLDGAPMGNGDGTNHVDACLADLGASRSVANSGSKPYGCSVKYGKQ